MQDLSGKSIPLLVSKLKTAIMTSERARGGLDMWRRREEIKDELVLRGEAALLPVMDLFNSSDEATVAHAADIVGRIGKDSVIIPLARILAEPYPQPTKRAAAKALRAINTPDAVLAVNIWERRLNQVRQAVTSFIQDRTGDDALLKQLAALAQRHGVSLEAVADAYLLRTTDEALSLDAQSRLVAVPLTPQECAAIESIATP
jgi:hypothetical protein